MKITVSCTKSAAGLRLQAMALLPSADCYLAAKICGEGLEYLQEMAHASFVINRAAGIRGHKQRKSFLLANGVNVDENARLASLYTEPKA